MTNQNQPFVCIYASQVAMCIGANKHKKISEAVDLLWHRCDAPSFRAAMRRNRLKTEDELTDDIISSNADVKQLVDLTLTAPCDSSDQVAKQYDSVTKGLRSVPLPDEDRKLVDDLLKRNLYTHYGNVHESKVLQYVRDTLGIPCREDPTFYKVQQGVCEGPWGSFPWYVGGKIDAIDEDRTLLIEIKNRVNRLFYRTPFYEQIQVQAYLHLLGLEQGILVECLKSSGRVDRECAPGPRPDAAEVAVNVIPVKRDRDLWERDVVPKLRGFVDFLARLMHDTALQDRYLHSKRRSAMVTAYINGYLKGSGLSGL
jgi:hypothetical protein